MDTLVTLARFLWLAEADLATAALRGYGVECFLADEHFLFWFPVHSVALGGVKLRVKESDAPDAIEILRRAVGEEKIDCPKCGSANVLTKERRSRFVFGLSACVLAYMLALWGGFIAGYIPPRRLKRTYRCEDCGFTWEYRYRQ